MISVYEERGIKKGIAQGIEQGIEKGKREMVLKSLRHKFGRLPKRVTTRVASLQAEELDTVFNQILDARTLEETGLTTD